jgi:hypothetical protein
LYRWKESQKAQKLDSQTKRFYCGASPAGRRFLEQLNVEIPLYFGLCFFVAWLFNGAVQAERSIPVKHVAKSEPGKAAVFDYERGIVHKDCRNHETR